MVRARACANACVKGREGEQWQQRKSAGASPPPPPPILAPTKQPVGTADDPGTLFHGRAQSMRVLAPSRTVVAYRRVDEAAEAAAEQEAAARGGTAQPRLRQQQQQEGQAAAPGHGAAGLGGDA